MKLKIISLCLLFVAVFISCKKEDDSVVVTSNQTLLSKVMIDKQPYLEYIYTNSKLISEEKSKYVFTKHTYNGKNQLISTDYYGNYDLLSSDLQVFETAMNRKEWVTPANGIKGGTIGYVYNSNEQLIKTTYSRPLSGSSEYSEFSYDLNGRISKQILYWEDIRTGYTDYSYDTKGNLIKESLYNVTSTGVAELSTTIQYEFDNMQNPYQSFSSLEKPGINTNSNNITKETYTINLSATQSAEQVQVTSSTYAYNGKGYPVSKNSNIEYVYQ